jgi:hypothetical protein
VQVRVERAKQYLADLKSAIDLWLDGDPHPYEVATKIDPQTGELVYYISTVRDAPVDLRLTAGDVLHNCRVSLDHTAYQLVLANGQQPTAQTAFPIFDDAATYETGKVRKVRGMGKNAVDYIDSIEPYEAGNRQLWMLHRLNNIDKHRLLLTATIGYEGRSITKSERVQYAPVASGARYIAAGRGAFHHVLERGYEFHREPPGSEVNQQMEVTADITLTEPPIVEAESLVNTLTQILYVTQAVTIDCAKFLI